MIDESARIGLKRAIANIDSLPAMPAIAQKLLALPLDTDEGEVQLLKLIGQDPQIYAKIIGMANSPMMGVSSKVSSVQDAVLLLGMNRVKSVAIGIASMSNLVKLAPAKYFNLQDLWLHSMTIAMVMHIIAKAMPRNLRPGDDQIFLAGLLHDIGFVVLHHINPVASDELHQQLRLQHGRPILDIELETLNITHCFIGAQLAMQWDLPPEIVEVLGYHHSPYVEKNVTGNPLVHLVRLAEKVVSDFGIAEHTDGKIYDHEWVELGISLADVEDIHIQANELALQAAQSGNMF
ncbi:MAG TPA: HDOD domain-containing protein [Gallionella sp.]|nr:HDOD domain-containing protein [Gallionella sp.]